MHDVITTCRRITTTIAHGAMETESRQSDTPGYPTTVQMMEPAGALFRVLRRTSSNSRARHRQKNATMIA